MLWIRLLDSLSNALPPFRTTHLFLRPSVLVVEGTRSDQHAHTLEQQVASPELLGCIIYDSKLHLTTCLQTASLIFHCETHHLVPANITPSRISPVLASMKYVDPFSCPKDAEETIDGRHAPFSCPKDADDTIDGCRAP